ncbi:MAG: hypothetical protein ACFNZR_00920 [Candidatus Nanosynbacter sp.]
MAKDVSKETERRCYTGPCEWGPENFKGLCISPSEIVECEIDGLLRTLAAAAIDPRRALHELTVRIEEGEKED